MRHKQETLNLYRRYCPLNSQLEQANLKQAESDELVAVLQKANELNNRDAQEYRPAHEKLRHKKEKLDQELALRGTSVSQLKNKAEASVQ